MSTQIGVGFVLQPDDEFLALTAEIAVRADYFEIAPESLWIERPDGSLHPNSFHARFLAAGRATSTPFVLHGVAYDLGSESNGDADRRRRWRERIRIDHARFGFQWWTEHAGATMLAGENMALPLAIPPGDVSERRIAARLLEMRDVLPDVGVENSAFYYLLGDPLDDARTLARALERSDAHLLLDLHNLHTNAVNLGCDPDAWLAEMDLGRVIEIHVSGGSISDPAWLPDGATMRLDAHDARVPDEIWAMLERLAPRCPQLRGITLERMEGTLANDADVRDLAEELARIDALVEALL